MGFTATFGIAAIASLIVFLATKELAGTGGSSISLRIARFVSVGIVPLVIAFAVMVAVEIAKVL